MVPSSLLKKLYVKKSMKIDDGNITFILKNVFMRANITKIKKIEVDSQECDLSSFRMIAGDREYTASDEIVLSVGIPIQVKISGNFAKGAHKVKIVAATKEVGELNFEIEDSVE